MTRPTILLMIMVTLLGVALGAAERTQRTADQRQTSDLRELSYKPLIVYSARGRRDPLVPPMYQRLQQDPSSIKIQQLDLTGLMFKGGHGVAMFRRTGGFFGQSFTLKGGKLWFNGSQSVENTTGRILDSQRVVLVQGEERLTYSMYSNH